MLAGLYLTLNAQFIAVMQVLVYAGAIMVLVVFVIMLLNLGDDEKLKEKMNLRIFGAVVLSCSLFVLLAGTFLSFPSGSNHLSGISAQQGTVQGIGTELFSNYLFPFEAVSLLLLAAIIGAVILAKRKID
jgi:NADH-quinone oxidoreductase subunit J